MKKIVFPLFFMAVTTSAWAQDPGIIFTPASATVGETVSLSWQATSRFCIVETSTGDTFSARINGSRQVKAQEGLWARISCPPIDWSGPDQTAVAYLDIIRPQMNVSLSKEIYNGSDGLPILSWNVPWATSCFSYNVPGVQGNQGSTPILPGDGQNFSFSVQCTNGQYSDVKSFTVLNHSPYLKITATPNRLSAPGWVTLSWEARHVGSCSGKSIPTGSATVWVAQTSYFQIDCITRDIVSSASTVVEM
jgi:hypothetical protein